MSDLTEADRKLVEDARLFVAHPKTRAVAPMWCEHIDGLLGIIDRQAPTLSIKSDSLAECATLFRAMKDNPGAPLRASIEIKGHPHLTATEPFSGEFEFRTDDALGTNDALDEQSCARLISDWFALRGIKDDPALLVGWLFCGGERLAMVFPRTAMKDELDKWAADRPPSGATNVSWQMKLVAGDEVIIARAPDIPEQPSAFAPSLLHTYQKSYLGHRAGIVRPFSLLNATPDGVPLAMVRIGDGAKLFVSPEMIDPVPDLAVKLTEPTKWRPIETAPKDGTHIELRGTGYHGFPDYRWDGFWNGKAWQAEGSGWTGKPSSWR